ELRYSRASSRRCGRLDLERQWSLGLPTRLPLVLRDASRFRAGTEGSRGGFGSLALSSDPAALPGYAAESPPLGMSRLVGEAGLRVDATQCRFHRAGRARRSELRGDLLVGRQAFEARPGQPGPAKTLHDLPLEGRQLSRSRGRDLLERLGRIGVVELRRPGEEDGLRADPDSIGVSRREWGPGLDPGSVQAGAVEAAAVRGVPATVAECERGVLAAHRRGREREVT